MMQYSVYTLPLSIVGLAAGIAKSNELLAGVSFLLLLGSAGALLALMAPVLALMGRT